MGARRTKGVEHAEDRGRKGEARPRRPRTRLTPALVNAIASAIRGGATLGGALVEVRDAMWRDTRQWLNTSSVYRWMQNARDGKGTVAERCLLAAVVTAEAERGHHKRTRSTSRVRIDALERRVQQLEARIAAIAGGQKWPH